MPSRSRVSAPDAQLQESAMGKRTCTSMEQYTWKRTATPLKVHSVFKQNVTAVIHPDNFLLPPWAKHRWIEQRKLTQAKLVRNRKNTSSCSTTQAAQKVPNTFSICDAKRNTQQETLCIAWCPWIPRKLTTVSFVFLCKTLWRLDQRKRKCL